MPRLMSVAHTIPQVRAHQKTVTRRLGWWEDRNGRRILHPGDRLTLCEKVQGRRGAPLVRICDVPVVSVTREPLDEITVAEVEREGFPGWTPAEFVDFYCDTFRVEPCRVVTRIEWAYS